MGTVIRCRAASTGDCHRAALQTLYILSALFHDFRGLTSVGRYGIEGFPNLRLPH